jgi:hypothetical protein
VLKLAPLTSVTVTFTLTPLAATVGVPPMAAELVVLALMFMPVGKPVAAQVYGPVPPDTETACEYGEFSVPPGRAEGSIADKAAFTTKLLVWLTFTGVLSLSVTLTVMLLNVPVAVGVPLITPCPLPLVVMFKPAGRLLAFTDQV